MCYMIHSHVYKLNVRPVASSRLFLDIQEVTLLLGEYTLFAVENLHYPLTRLCSDFSTIFVALIRVYTRTMGCKKSFRYMLAFIIIIQLNSQISLLKFLKNKKSVREV